MIQVSKIIVEGKSMSGIDPYLSEISSSAKWELGATAQRFGKYASPDKIQQVTKVKTNKQKNLIRFEDVKDPVRITRKEKNNKLKKLVHLFYWRCSTKANLEMGKINDGFSLRQ